MAILKVARLGHPVLRLKAEPVPATDVKSKALQGFIDDLLETMYEYDGAGLAAPQVHVSQRICVYVVGGEERRAAGKTGDEVVLVNPVVTALSDELVEDWEGCLSLPDLRGKVPRVTAVKVEALGRDGKPLSFVAKDFHARVVLHETDHLDGVVYVDRMRDLASLSFIEEFSRYAEVES